MNTDTSTDIAKQRTTPPPGFDPTDITPPPLKDGPWMVQSLVLDVSGSCNMACRYCAESATMPPRQPMSQETLEKAWRFLFPNGVDAVTGKNLYSFHLGTGEPILNLALVKELGKKVRGAHDGGSEIPYVFMTTNSLLLDRESMDWLVDSGWKIKVSLDGPAAIHDRCRVLADGSGTYDAASRAVTYMAEKMPDRLAVCAVLCRDADPADVFAGIESLGVRQVDLAPVAHHDDALIPTAEDIAAYDRFVRAHAQRFLAEDLTPENLPPVLTNFNQCVMRLMGYKQGRAVCGAGRHYYASGPSGDLYPCGRFIGVEKYRLGHLDTGLDQDAARGFRENAGRTYERRSACNACWAAPLCSGPCFACAEMFGPGDGAPIDYQCAYVLATARAAVSLVNRLRENDPERLLYFMPRMGMDLMNSLGL